MDISKPAEFKHGIEILRKMFFESLTDDRLGDFEETDLTRFREDDLYCESFLKHHDGDVIKARKMVIESLKWRKEFGVYGINEDDVLLEIRKSGTLYKSHHDKQGNPIRNVLIYNMPSLFQTVWQIVKHMVPKHLRGKVVFVDKDTIKQFVNDKFLPIRMGGKDGTEFVYTPGEWI